MENSSLSKNLKQIALESGIDVMGFCDASGFNDYSIKSSLRRNPKLSMPAARTIIVAGVYIGGLTLKVWDDPEYGRTSRLFMSSFFLDVVNPLRQAAEFLRTEGYRAIICDSSGSKGSIIPLKLAAVRAGLGWQGKNSLLITRKYGSFLALGGIITDAFLDHNTKEEQNFCGTCTKCQEACPLAALDEPYKLKIDRCLSYFLQVDEFPGTAQAVSENRVADCEICQQACSWNRKHISSPLPTGMTKYFQKNIADWKEIFYLPKLVRMTKAKYNAVFGPLKTGIPFELFHRNVLNAARNADIDSA